MIHRQASITLRSVPARQKLPAGEILNALIRSDFEPEKSRAALSDIEKSISDSGIRSLGIADGGYLVQPSVWYPRPGRYAFFIKLGDQEFSTWLTASNVAAVANHIRIAARENDRDAIANSWPFRRDSFPEWAYEVDMSEVDHWDEVRGPGIFRREHASLVVSSGTTNILIDPISLQKGLPHLESAPLQRTDEQVDAILVTHSHGDHWHLPSVLRASAGSAVPVIVPTVPCTSLLCVSDFVSELSICRQTHIQTSWWETIKVGDIEIDILPFFGEQPSVKFAPDDHKIRNWGNCYRINCPTFSCMILCDSGNDPLGTTESVAARSNALRGPVDCVLSCLREFPAPFFGGLESYWGALTWAKLQVLFNEYKAHTLPPVTGGIAGTALACKAAGAKFFLPYAHGYCGRASAIEDIGWGEGEISEREAVRLLNLALKDINADTVAVNWNAGDRACLKVESLSGDGDLVIGKPS